MAESTSFQIDIDVQAGGVPAAQAALDGLGSSLTGAGASAVTLASQLATARTALEAAAAASTAAAGAVAQGEASYAAAEVGADRAARAVERIGQQLDAQRGKFAAAMEAGDTSGMDRAEAAIGRLVTKREEAAAKASAAASALEGEAAALDALREAASGAEAEHAALAGTVDGLEGELEEVAAAEQAATDAAAGSGNISGLGEAFGKLGGPVGAAGQKLFGAADGIKKMVGSMGAGMAAAAAFTVVAVALVAALAVGAVKIAVWAVGLADANRSAALSTEALSRSKAAFAGLGSLLPKVAASTGLTADHLTDLAKQAEGAGVSAKDMPAALEAMAIAEAALGKGGAADLVKDLKEGKKSASALAAEMQSKFGDIVAKKMLSLDGTAAKLNGNLSETFGGLKIEGLLGGLSKMVDLLDSSSSSGRAIKFLFETMFQPLIDAATSALPSVERFMLGIVLGALKMYNAFKPAIRAIGEFAGASDGVDIDWATVGQGVIYTLAGAFAMLAAGVLLAIAPFVAIGMAIYTLIDLGSQAVDAISGVGDSIMETIGGIDLASAGTALIDGLVEGILGGMSSVISAVTSIGSAAISAAESALQMGSPSKVFRKIGGFTSEGMALGVEDGAEDVKGAMTAMVTPPEVAPGGGAGGGGGGNFAGATFNFHGIKGAEQIVPELRVMLTEILRGGMSPAPA